VILPFERVRLRMVLSRRRTGVARERHKPDAIVAKLRQMEVLVS
jgi:hypothetical protein